MAAWFYILRLRSGRLYIGSTSDLATRCRLHAQGKASLTTKADPPVALAYHEELPTYSVARLREAQVKRWTRAKKEALIRGDLAQLHTLSKRRSARPTNKGRAEDEFPI